MEVYYLFKNDLKINLIILYMKLEIINSIKEFKESIKKKHVTVFYFYSDKFEELTLKINNILKDIYDASIFFYSINIDKNKEIIDFVDLTTFPIFYIYKDSNFIKEIYCSNNLEQTLKNLYI
jgi:hypothetical protein